MWRENSFAWVVKPVQRISSYVVEGGRRGKVRISGGRRKKKEGEERENTTHRVERSPTLAVRVPHRAREPSVALWASSWQPSARVARNQRKGKEDEPLRRRYIGERSVECLKDRSVGRVAFRFSLRELDQGEHQILLPFYGRGSNGKKNEGNDTHIFAPIPYALSQCAPQPLCTVATSYRPISAILLS